MMSSVGGRGGVAEQINPDLNPDLLRTSEVKVIGVVVRWCGSVNGFLD